MEVGQLWVQLGTDLAGLDEGLTKGEAQAKEAGEKIEASLKNLRAAVDTAGLDEGLTEAVSKAVRSGEGIDEALGSLRAALDEAPLAEGLAEAEGQARDGREAIEAAIGELQTTLNTAPLTEGLERGEIEARAAAEAITRDFDGMKLQAQVTLNEGEFRRSAEHVRTEAQGLGESIKQFFTYTVAYNLGQSALYGLGQAMQNVAQSAIGFDSTMEQAQVAFTTLLGGASQATDFINQMKQFAATTPFDYTDVQKYAQEMLALGFNAQDVIPWLTSVGNATSALGAGPEILGRIIVALGQMKQAGSIHAQDMNQLIQAGIPAWQMLADAMHKTVAEVKQMSSSGNLSSDVALPIFKAGMDSRYGGMMEAQSHTFAGLMSNIHDDAQQAAGAISQSLYNSLKNAAVQTMALTDKVRQMAAEGKSVGQIFMALIPPSVGNALRAIFDPLIRDAKDAKPILEDIGDTIRRGLVAVGPLVLAAWQGALNVLDMLERNWGALRPVLALVVGILGTYHAIMLAKNIVDGIQVGIVQAQILYWTLARGAAMAMLGVMRAWELAQAALNAVMDANPIGIVIVVLGLLVAATVLVVTHWKQIRDVMVSVFSFAVPYVREAVSEITSFWRNNSQEIMQIVKSAWDFIHAAFVIAWDIIRPFLQNMLRVMGDSWRLAWQAIRDVVRGVWDAIYGVIKVSLDLILAIVTPILDLLTGHWQKAWDDLKGYTLKAIEDIWSMIRREFADLGRFFKDAGSNLVHMMADGITGAIGSVVSAVQNVAKTVKSWLGFHSPTEEGPGSDADRWAPAFVSMYAQGLQAGVPRIRAAAGALASAVNPVPGMGAMPGGLGGPAGAALGSVAQTATFVIQMDGRTLAKGVLPFVPGELVRAGVVVR